MIDSAAVDRLWRTGTISYATALERFAQQHGWEVHTGAPIHCLHRLDDPAHRPRYSWVRGACFQGLHHGIGEDGRNLDHLAWLRRGPARRPEQWALLSQPYGDVDPSGTALHLGPAPYGLGSAALLYVGRPRRRGDH